MSIFEFPMVFPAGGALLMGRVYRNVDDLVTPQPAVVVTGAWLTVKEQMARTYALRLAEQGITAFTFDFTGFGQSGARPASSSCPLGRPPIWWQRSIFLSTMSFVREGGVGYVGICASAQYALAAIAQEYSSTWTTTPIHGAARCRSGKTRWRRCRGSSG